MPRFSAIIFLAVFTAWSLNGQNDSSIVNYRERKIILASSSVGVAGISLLGLNHAWYSEYNTGKFHFFNDNAEWMQVDKAGHFFTTYQTARLMMQAFDWAGCSRKQQLFIGGSWGFVYMSAIEIMDGFSRGWGFSWGDQSANLLGSAMAIAQEARWKEQRIQVKFSYSNSGLANYNPSLLGEDNYSRLIKDYNGQTLWLSVNPVSFLNGEPKFPSWLNVAIGYGAYGMLGGHDNPALVDEAGRVIHMNRVRQYYLSLDIDLTRVPVKSKFLKAVFSVVNILKFPAPALELSQNKLRFIPLHY